MKGVVEDYLYCDVKLPVQSTIGIKDKNQKHISYFLVKLVVTSVIARRRVVESASGNFALV